MSRWVICQVHLSRNYIPVVISSLNHTSLSFIIATFLTICLITVLQPSRYSIFYSRDTPIWLGLPWQSYSCQCLNTKTLSIFYSKHLYIRLVITSLIINEDKLLLNLIPGVQQWHTKSILTPISDFFLFSEIMTTQQTNGTAYKLKPRSLHKSAHLQAYLTDFYPGVNHTWQDNISRLQKTIEHYRRAREY